MRHGFAKCSWTTPENHAKDVKDQFDLSLGSASGALWLIVLSMQNSS
jgi:hypothetical protein